MLLRSTGQITSLYEHKRNKKSKKRYRPSYNDVFYEILYANMYFEENDRVFLELFCMLINTTGQFRLKC